MGDGTTLNGGGLAARTLREAGVEVVFALHGGHLDTFLTGCRREGIRLVDCRHEAAAVNAADGYARSTGRLGVAAVTSGPGLFNAVAGISAAAADRVGVLVITSSPPLGEAETNELQGGLDQIGVVRPITNWAHRATAAHRIADLVGLAVRHAIGGGRRGPVVLDIPIDVGFSPVRAERLAPAGAPVPPPPPVVAPEVIDRIVAAVDAAERPMVIVGDGSLTTDLRAPLQAFAEATGIPVFRSGASSGGLPGTHSLAAGGISGFFMLPMFGTPPADLVVLVGASHGMFLAGRNFAAATQGATVVQLHTDAAEIGRLGPVGIGAIGDLGAALASIAAAATTRDRGDWAATAVKAKTFAHSMFEHAGMEADGMHPFRAAAVVADSLPAGCVLVRDGGEAAAWLDWAAGNCDLHTDLTLGYQGHLGVGQGYAIGAQLAHPDRRVVQLVGDGAIGFNLAEWDTMVRHDLPIVTIVFNNACWGMSIHGQHAVYGPEGDVITRLAPTRYDLVAEGFGAFGQHVTDPDELAAALERAYDSGRPSVIDVAISASVVHPVTNSLLGNLAAKDEIVVPYYTNIPK